MAVWQERGEEGFVRGEAAQGLETSWGPFRDWGRGSGCQAEQAPPPVPRAALFPVKALLLDENWSLTFLWSTSSRLTVAAGWPCPAHPSLSPHCSWARCWIGERPLAPHPDTQRAQGIGRVVGAAAGQRAWLCSGPGLGRRPSWGIAASPLDSCCHRGTHPWGCPGTINASWPQESLSWLCPPRPSQLGEGPGLTQDMGRGGAWASQSHHLVTPCSLHPQLRHIEARLALPADSPRRRLSPDTAPLVFPVSMSPACAAARERGTAGPCATSPAAGGAQL